MFLCPTIPWRLLVTYAMMNGLAGPGISYVYVGFLNTLWVCLACR